LEGVPYWDPFFILIKT